jgi:hypothetical protein
MVPLGIRVALAALAVGGCTVSFQEQAAYDEAFALEGLTRVEIRGLVGGLDLRAAGDSAFVARGTAWAAGATRAAALDNLGEARLSRRVGDGAMMTVFDPPLDLLGLVDLELDRVSDAPAEVAILAHLDGGDIATSGLRGSLDLATPDGDIAAEGAGPGAVLLRAPRGKIEVDAGGSVEARAGRALEIRSRGQGGEPIRGSTAGGRILLLLEQRDFHILCWPEGGEVTVDQDLDADVAHGADGSVLVTGGDQVAARDVVLSSLGGDIAIEFLSQ